MGRTTKDSILQRLDRRTENPANVRAPAKSDSPIRRVVLAITELRAGGAERLVVHLATGLKRSRIEPIVVCLWSKGPLATDLEAQGITVHAFESRQSYDFAAIWSLRALLRRTNPDIVNAHDRWAFLYMAFATRMAPRPPLVFSAHGLMYGEPKRAKWRYRLAARVTAGKTAVSEEVAARHASYFGWERPAQIVPNGVPEPVPSLGSRERLRAVLGVPAQAFVFLAVGNVRPEKGFEDLLEAAAALRCRLGPQAFNVLVAGGTADEPYRHMLDALQTRLGLKTTVSFLGYREDTADLYAAADAFVLSSRSEGLPMVLLEAMMAGLPIVATRVGGVPGAVVDCGLLVDREAPDQLAEAMGRLVHEPGLAADLGRRARRRAVREFSVERMTSRYVEVYERVAAGRRRRKGR